MSMSTTRVKEEPTCSEDEASSKPSQVLHSSDPARATLLMFVYKEVVSLEVRPVPKAPMGPPSSSTLVTTTKPLEPGKIPVRVEGPPRLWEALITQAKKKKVEETCRFCRLLITNQSEQFMRNRRMISQHFLRVCQRAGLEEAQKLLDARPDLKISLEEEEPIKNLWNTMVTAMDMRDFAGEVRKELDRPTLRFTLAGTDEKGEKKQKRELSGERDS